MGTWGAGADCSVDHVGDLPVPVGAGRRLLHPVAQRKEVWIGGGVGSSFHFISFHCVW